ncbi:MAG: hypothetical protein ACLQOO_10140 [Terriglobia bacterium]
MELWVGLGVIASNLLALARAAAPKSGRPQSDENKQQNKKEEEEGQGSPKSPDGG